MRLDDAREIIECLPRGKTRFYYFKDRYALVLLSLLNADLISKHALRKSCFASLLDKPIVKSVLEQNQGKQLSAQTFETFWPRQYECYFLSLGLWGAKHGDWHQTSRPGHNLVLRLNFSSAHDVHYKKLIDPDAKNPFSCFYHPIDTSGLHTLAWSRLDIDLKNGEALVEEVQTDWIRDALAAKRRATRAETSMSFYGVEMRAAHVIRYVDSILRAHQKVWDEAMLSATVWFLRKELGVQTIYYHTHTSGARLKNIHGCLPPRSVYSRLPKRFCFRPTAHRPSFIPARARPARANPRYDNASFLKLEFAPTSLTGPDRY